MDYNVEFMSGHHEKIKLPVGFAVNDASKKKRRNKKFNVPVIAYFADRSIVFKSIIDAEKATGIHYTLIFEACIGKIYKAGGILWEYYRGNHYIKYKAYYINASEGYQLF